MSVKEYIIINSIKYLLDNTFINIFLIISDLININIYSMTLSLSLLIDILYLIDIL